MRVRDGLISTFTAMSTMLWPTRVKGFLIAIMADYGFSMSGHLEELAVAEGEQGSGLGRELVAACEAWLRGQGVNTVFVSALDTAVGFYTRLGYQPCVGPWRHGTRTRGRGSRMSQDLYKRSGRPRSSTRTVEPGALTLGSRGHGVRVGVFVEGVTNSRA